MKYHRDYLLRYWSKFLIEKNFFSTVKLLEYGGQVKTLEDNFIPYFKRNDSEKDKMTMKAYLENYEFFYAKYSNFFNHERLLQETASRIDYPRGGTTALGKEQECQIGSFVSIYLLKNKTILLCKLSRGGLLNNEC